MQKPAITNNSASRRPWQWLIYPFLVGALPAVHFNEVNFRLLQGTDLLRPLLLSFLLVGILLLLGRWWWRSFSAAALVVTPLLVVIFKGNDVGGLLCLGFIALSIFLGFVLRRRQETWSGQMALPLNLALLVLVAMPLKNTLRASGMENTPQVSEFFQSDIPLPALNNPAAAPDIYYIMVDGLGRPDFIEKNFPIAKEKYSDLFTARDFQVLRHSNANYPQTALSTSATFNLCTMDQALDITDPKSGDRRILAETAGNSRAVRALRKLGYRVVSYPSGYPLTRQKLADRRRHPFLNPSFVEYYLLNDGILPLVLPLLGKGPADVAYDLRRGRLNYIFDHLAEARVGIADEDPVFVYTHILAPHPPFVFGPEGQALPSRAKFAFADGDHWLHIHGKQNDSYRQLYADQATWIMARLAKTVDEIIASSDRLKIIIIQGDHGPGSRLHWERPLETDQNERLGIFNAWYVSDGRQLRVYEGMTAVNTFPLLFNSFLGGNLARLPDELWFARMSKPFTYFQLEQ